MGHENSDTQLKQTSNLASSFSISAVSLVFFSSVFSPSGPSFFSFLFFYHYIFSLWPKRQTSRYWGNQRMIDKWKRTVGKKIGVDKTYPQGEWSIQIKQRLTVRTQYVIHWLTFRYPKCSPAASSLSESSLDPEPGSMLTGVLTTSSRA